jgi:hypothetical protein
MSDEPRPLEPGRIQPLNAEWRRAGQCASNGCVEVAQIGENIVVRDTKDLAGPTLRYSRDEWTAFVAAVKAGEFDLG